MRTAKTDQTGQMLLLVLSCGVSNVVFLLGPFERTLSFV